MSEKYKIRDQNKLHFLTFTVKDWIDIFIDDNYKMIIIKSLNFCQQNKGMEIFGYCIMSTHIHIIARVKENYRLSDCIRDFKKYTSKAIIKHICQKDKSGGMALIDNFRNKRAAKSGKDRYTFWKEGNHPVEITSNKFFDQKLEYIHNNPVKAL